MVASITKIQSPPGPRINKEHDYAMCAYEALNDVDTRLNTVSALQWNVPVRTGVNMRSIPVQRRYPSLSESFCFNLLANAKQGHDLKL
jgi:hypothetical protein